jgi:hypothetical protein
MTITRSDSAHRRIDAGDELAVEWATLGSGKAFVQFRAILDSEDNRCHTRDGERVAMGERHRRFADLFG